jgi:hypothetical protein
VAAHGNLHISWGCFCAKAQRVILVRSPKQLEMGAKDDTIVIQHGHLKLVGLRAAIWLWQPNSMILSGTGSQAENIHEVFVSWSKEGVVFCFD